MRGRARTKRFNRPFSPLNKTRKKKVGGGICNPGGSQTADAQLTGKRRSMLILYKDFLVMALVLGWKSKQNIFPLVAASDDAGDVSVNDQEMNSRECELAQVMDKAKSIGNLISPPGNYEEFEYNNIVIKWEQYIWSRKLRLPYGCITLLGTVLTLPEFLHLTVSAAAGYGYLKYTGPESNRLFDEFPRCPSAYTAGEKDFEGEFGNELLLEYIKTKPKLATTYSKVTLPPSEEIELTDFVKLNAEPGQMLPLSFIASVASDIFVRGNPRFETDITEFKNDGIGRYLMAIGVLLLKGNKEVKITAGDLNDLVGLNATLTSSDKIVSSASIRQDQVLKVGNVICNLLLDILPAGNTIVSAILGASPAVDAVAAISRSTIGTMNAAINLPITASSYLFSTIRETVVGFTGIVGNNLIGQAETAVKERTSDAVDTVKDKATTSFRNKLLRLVKKKLPNHQLPIFAIPDLSAPRSLITLRIWVKSALEREENRLLSGLKSDPDLAPSQIENIISRMGTFDRDTDFDLNLRESKIKKIIREARGEDVETDSAETAGAFSKIPLAISKLYLAASVKGRSADYSINCGSIAMEWPFTATKTIESVASQIPISPQGADKSEIITSPLHSGDVSGPSLPAVVEDLGVPQKKRSLTTRISKGLGYMIGKRNSSVSSDQPIALPRYINTSAEGGRRPKKKRTVKNKRHYRNR